MFWSIFIFSIKKNRIDDWVLNSKKKRKVDLVDGSCLKLILNLAYQTIITLFRPIELK